MDSKTTDLLQYAQEYASQETDLYDLLGVDALTPKEDIHRAWRKRSLKYHPDKAGDSFDAEKWQLFERARDILSEPAARAAYDNAMKASLMRKQEREAMDRQRRKFVDDLEARENAWKREKEDKEMRDREAVEKERARLVEEKRMRDEESRRQADAAQEMEDLLEAKRRIKERKEKEKQDKAREKFLKEARKKAAAAAAAPSEELRPQKRSAESGIGVPGDYVVDFGDAKQKYWELVCDKLRAVQVLRNLKKQDDATAAAYSAAQKSLEDVKMRIHRAQVQYAESVTRV